MPADFTKCVKNGGKVVTKKLKGGKYMNICYDKDGNSYQGEVKTIKKGKSKKHYAKKKRNGDKIRKSKALAADLLKLKKHFDDLRAD